MSKTLDEALERMRQRAREVAANEGGAGRVPPQAAANNGRYWAFASWKSGPWKQIKEGTKEVCDREAAHERYQGCRTVALPWGTWPSEDDCNNSKTGGTT